MIRKGSIVWYWHHKEKVWLRGKVISVNKYRGPARSNTWPGLTVKDRHSRNPYHIPPYQRAFPASDPRPTHEPYDDYPYFWHKKHPTFEPNLPFHHSYKQYKNFYKARRLVERMGLEKTY